MKRFQPYFKYFKPVKWQLAGSVLAGLVYAAATGAGLPLAAKVVLPLLFEDDQVDAGGGENENSFFVEGLMNWFESLPSEWVLAAACAWLPLMFLFRAVGGFLNTYLISYCGFRFLEQVRDEVFTKLQTLPVAFFQKRQAGDLLARLVGDAEVVRSTVGKVAVDLIKQPAVLIAALVFLVSEAVSNQGASLVLFSIFSIPLCVLPLRAIAKRLGDKARKLQASAGDLSGQISESIQAPLEIRAYNLQHAVVQKFRGRIKGIIRYSMKVVKYKQLISPSVEFVSVVGLTVAIYLGAQQGMKLSSFMAIAMALYLCYEPVKKLGAIQANLKQADASLERLEEISLAVDHLDDPEHPRRPENFESRVIFKDVSFGYGDEVVLRGINLTIEPGQCVALIGPSGGGKSSLFNLIPRFYDVKSGGVTVSGIDVREWAKKELRDQIAVVSQTAVLFQGTIRENILLGRPDANEEEVISAAKKANAHDFILKQKHGYDTAVSEMGRSLSGGQRQRIAIARAFLKDAPILLLDEATSALDNESEAIIQSALVDLVKGRTTLLIAHRLSTTKIASRVIELDQGVIVSERAEA
ncbi:ABC transporter ATP-binding protein/permease [bacterium]|jgi:subfamily B ATP-binding cassette protein MsbA|nr:ABC transporter ATP-binding protein/permease [bacterium]